MYRSSKYRPLTQAIFDQEIINESRPAILVFGADWSGTAEMMNGIAERIANESGHDVNFYYVDIEKMKDTTRFFGVSSVPTILFIKQGELINKVQGLVSASKFRKLLHADFPKSEA